MNMHDGKRLPLRSYVNGSVATTWTISYTAVRRENEAAANLLLLWAHLNNKGLWHGLLAAASQKGKDRGGRDYGIAAKQAVAWLREIAHSQVDFIKAIGILRAYSLVEEAEDLDCYSTHPVVHQWAFHMQDDNQRTALSWLAVVLVGLSVPSRHTKNYWETQSRLLPHAEQCEMCVLTEDLANQGVEWGDNKGDESKKTLLIAICRLGDLYYDQQKLNKAEKMYMLALGNENNLSKQSNVHGFDAARGLCSVYSRQHKFGEAKELLFEALELQKILYGENAPEILSTIRSLGYLYISQGKFDEAEEMMVQAFTGYKRTEGEDHWETLHSLKDLSTIYLEQGKYEKAENILSQILEGRKKTLVGYDLLLPAAIADLGEIYNAQEKFEQAEEMLTQALEEFEKILGSRDILTHIEALHTMSQLGVVYDKLDKLDKARECFSKALPGYEKLFGEEHERCQNLRYNIAVVDRRKKDTSGQNDDSTRRKGWGRWLGERFFHKYHK